MLRNRPIRHLMICGALLAVAITAGTATMVDHFRNRALDDSQRELKNTALILAEQIDRTFQAIELVQGSVMEKIQALRVVSSADYTRLMSRDDVHLVLKASISGLIQVDVISLIDADGTLVNFSRDDSIPAINLSDRDYFKALKSDANLDSFIGLPVRSRGAGTWTLYLARKLKAPNGEFLGMVLGAVQLSYFDKIFDSIVLRNESSITLYRDDGILLTRYPRADSFVGTYFKSPLKALGNSDRGTARVIGQIEGKDRLLAVHRLLHFPLFISVAVDTAAALADWKKETDVLLSVGALAALTVAAIILLIARQSSAEQRLHNQQLALEKQHLYTAINSILHGLVLFDSSNRIVICNKRYIEMFELSPEVVKPGCTVRDLLCHRKATGSFLGDVDEFLATVLGSLGRGTAIETTTETTNGRLMQIVIQPMMGGGWVSTQEDVTERRKIERERDRSREFFELVINNVPAAIVVKDAGNRRYVMVNQTGEEYFGVSRDLLIGKAAHEVWPPASADLISKHDDKLLQSDGYLFVDEHRFDVPVTSSRFVTLKSLVIRDDKAEPQYLLHVIEDVTERRLATERMMHLAHHDALTDLPNRVLFREKLERSLKWVDRGSKIAILYLDLDQFKTVNDTLGHPVGDELLKVVAARLGACLRETDLIARLGGDEFAIIQTAVTSPADVIGLVTRIHKTIREPCDVSGHLLVVDASIGIAMAPNDGTDPDRLLKSADLAMYDAKADGRGTYRFFEPVMDTRVKARRALESDLRQAIASGAFDLHYQPLVRIRDNMVTGCEALLRWCHPERGTIPPTEFIPIAEETNLIIPLGAWVLRRACAEAATWPDDIKVAVNISPVQFRNGNLAQLVIDALETSRLPARRLELEITEAILIRDDEAALAVLHQLRAIGVRIALDDFGTGYSSLSYLQRFPFDKIKIDRSFINDVTEPDGSRYIVQAVEHIATSRNITTTAEGVETEQQKEMLRSLGCTEMQGYLFSRPLPGGDIGKFLRSRGEKTPTAAVRSRDLEVHSA